ncbi:MAG: phytochelatin synthase family protein [Synechocystis sp.]|nr:phytochelatin synthase family protein [Synechocystis sp.]
MNRFLVSLSTIRSFWWYRCRHLMLAIAVGTIVADSPRGVAQTLPLPESLTAYDTVQGEKYLIESTARDDFWELSAQFLTQITQSYCGVASAVMVLNSLGLPAPLDSRYQPYAVFTQENFFHNPKTDAVLPAQVVQRQGMTLQQLGQLLASHGAAVTVIPASTTTLEEFRRLARENLAQPDNYVLINYRRRELGQKIGGHISPLAAYHEASDRFLILDVARYKYPPVWVKAADLWGSINTIDPVSRQSRGFILIEKPPLASASQE